MERGRNPVTEGPKRTLRMQPDVDIHLRLDIGVGIGVNAARNIQVRAERGFDLLVSSQLVSHHHVSRVHWRQIHFPQFVAAS